MHFFFFAFIFKFYRFFPLYHSLQVNLTSFWTVMGWLLWLWGRKQVLGRTAHVSSTTGGGPMMSTEPKSQGTDTVLSGSKVRLCPWAPRCLGPWEPAPGTVTGWHSLPPGQHQAPPEQEETGLASEESSWDRPRLARGEGARPRASICWAPGRARALYQAPLKYHLI